VTSQVPYCGAPPDPGELLARFNLDPVLIVALVLACASQLIMLHRLQGTASRRRAKWAIAGWAVASAAFISPICALSVALFSARIAQHMLLILVAAPLIALGLPRASAWHHGWRLWASSVVFFAALWFWHMPAPYDATFGASWIYWAMHLTLFGSSLFLWRELLHHPARQTGQVLAAGTLTFMQMGLLGAVLTLADRPMFQWHLTTTQAWGLSALQDQQLGGVIMWVPGTALFLWIAVRSLSYMWQSLERARPA
jgi:putative membrane protein